MKINTFFENFKRRTSLEKLVISVGAVFCLLAVLSIASVATTLPRFIVGACVYVGIVALIINIILEKIRSRQKNLEQKGAAESLHTPGLGKGTQRKPRNKVITILLLLWYIYCFISIVPVPVCIFLAGFGVRMVSSRIQFPLGGVDSIATDSMGRVYCGISFYSRIQVYSNDGSFLRGWFVPDSVMMLEVDSNDRLHYLALRNDKHYIFKPDGELFKEERVSESFAREFGPNSNLQIDDSLGNIYKIKEPWLFPNVIKISPSGDAVVLVSDPFYLWLFRAPLPSWGLNALIGITWTLLESRKKKNKENVAAQKA